MTHMRQQVAEIYDKHKDLVSVSCDEYHKHKASYSCLSGPRESVDICLMFEYVATLEARLTNIMVLADTCNIR